jgi:phospholipase C
MPTALCVLAVGVLLTFGAAVPARADGDLGKVNHIIIVMQENHSFDNYFGVLAYAPRSPYHAPQGQCANDDHRCIDGLTCAVESGGKLVCQNSNIDTGTSPVSAFHNPSRCVMPDLNHDWDPTHQEINYENPNDTLADPLTDGFVRVNDASEQQEGLHEDLTMSYYDQTDLPFYYDLAEKFAISDRHFSSVLGPTFPNRSYLMAATSFGHLTSADFVPPGLDGYQPITGTIFDLLDENGVSWADFFQDAPQAIAFRPIDSHNQPLEVFYAEAESGVGLPQVVFLDPDFGINGIELENDEHPPTDVQRGQAYVSQVVNAIRNGPYWQDSIIFITYDEHGGFYDHARPPAARQAGARTPDYIAPGQCADLSNPPASERPGGGAECSWNFVSSADTSVLDAEALCPALKANPTGPYPAQCASFDQLGVRVPLIAVSPFAKRRYVSHTVGDHTSLLALIEKRFLKSEGAVPQHLTLRDKYANTLEDLFDFDHSRSLNTPVGTAAPPAKDCTPKKGGGSLAIALRGAMQQRR